MNLTFFNLVVTQGKGKVNEMMKREKLINLSVRHEKQKEKRKREEKRKMQQPGSLASVPPRSRRDNKLSATKKKETFYSKQIQHILMWGAIKIQETNYT